MKTEQTKGVYVYIPYGLSPSFSYSHTGAFTLN
nr:MAG TPA: hypothetical protein [Caudoviricetes sp.]